MILRNFSYIKEHQTISAMTKNSQKTTLPYWRKNNSLHFSIGLVLSMMLVVTAFEWNFRNELTDKPLDNIKKTANTEIDLIVREEPLPPRPKVPDFSEPVIANKPIVTTATTDIEKFNIVPKTTDIPDLTNLFGHDPEGKEVAPKAVYELIPAAPKEGMDAFYQYLYKKIRYPEHLSSRNLTGKVEVTFIIDKDGKITNVEILKGFDRALEKEIIRILENAPAWEPAQLGIEKVKTQHRIPFSFNIK